MLLLSVASLFCVFAATGCESKTNPNPTLERANPDNPNRPRRGTVGETDGPAKPKGPQQAGETTEVRP
jgi:hypothetical protein